jgi:hypothetical protein
MRFNVLRMPGWLSRKQRPEAEQQYGEGGADLQPMTDPAAPAFPTSDHGQEARAQ